MRFLISLFCLALLTINFVNCFPAEDVNVTESSTYQKVKDGVKSFGSKVSNVAVKGYEELKNLFSSDRKVGDYQLQNIDVRVRDEEDYEEVGVRRKTKRETKEKRDDLMSHHMTDELAEIMKDILVLQTTKGPKRSLVLENNAEIEPGLPLQFEVIKAPLVCPENQILVKGNCQIV